MISQGRWRRGGDLYPTLFTTGRVGAVKIPAWLWWVPVSIHLMQKGCSNACQKWGDEWSGTPKSNELLQITSSMKKWMYFQLECVLHSGRRCVYWRVHSIYIWLDMTSSSLSYSIPIWLLRNHIHNCLTPTLPGIRKQREWWTLCENMNESDYAKVSCLAGKDTKTSILMLYFWTEDLLATFLNWGE